VNKRGRKSKKLPEGYAIGARQGSEFDDGMEDYDAGMNASDMLSEDEEMEIGEGTLLLEPGGPHQSVLDFRPGRRPSQLARSATDPAPRKLKGRAPSGLENVFIPEDAPMSTKGAFTPTNGTEPKPLKRSATEMPPVAPQKRPRTSTEAHDSGTNHRPLLPHGQREALREPSTEEEQGPQVSMKLTEGGLLFKQDELLEFFKSGVESHSQAAQAYQDEKVIQRKAFEDALARSHQRVHEAQTTIREMNHQHKQDMRVAEVDYLEKAGNLRLDFDARVEELEKELNGLRSTPAAPTDTDALLGPSIQTPVKLPGVGVHSLPIHPQIRAPTGPSHEAQVTAFADQLRDAQEAVDAQRVLFRNIEANLFNGVPTDTNGPMSHAIEAGVRAQNLSSLVGKLSSELEDMSQKAIMRSLSEIQQLCDDIVRMLRQPQVPADPPVSATRPVPLSVSPPAMQAMESSMGEGKAMDAAA